LALHVYKMVRKKDVPPGRMCGRRRGKTKL